MSRFYKKFLIKTYWNINSVVSSYVGRGLILKNSSISLSLPKRQQFINLLNLKTNKHLNLSAGVFFIRMGRLQKFFKRNPKNIMTLTLQLKKDYIYYFKKIYIFYIKNFNYRQYCLYQKIMELINPSIYYFVHHQSFMPKFLKKKRIKRRVLKTLKKQ